MKTRNPVEPKRFSKINADKTRARVEQFYGLSALLATWEMQPAQMQAENRDYLLRLRKKLRNVRNYLAHRSEAGADI